MTTRRRRERPSHNAARERKPRRQGQLGEVIQPPTDTTTSKAPRYTRRLSDKILIAFHQACDERDLEAAERLLAVLAMVFSPRLRPQDAPDRRAQESLVAAYERLWDLRHPDLIGGSDEPV